MTIKTKFLKRCHLCQWVVEVNSEPIARGLSFSRDDAGLAAKQSKTRWIIARMMKMG